MQHTANADRETTLETPLPTETLHAAADLEMTSSHRNTSRNLFPHKHC